MQRVSFIRSALLLAVLCLSGGCHHAATSGVVLERQLIGEVMMHSELAPNLRALCMPGGRLSGSENGHEAERFVADKLREYGLKNVHLEPFEMATWQDEYTSVTVMTDPPEVLEGAISLGNCLSTPPEGLSAALIYAGQGAEEELDALGAEVKGRFVLVREGGPHRGSKMKDALKRGAAGLIIISRLDDRGRVGQCHREPSPAPGVVITGADGAKLVERLQAGEQLTLNVEIKAHAWQATPNNVVGEIPGRGAAANEVVILGAHLDSWHLAEGGIDNGTGSVAILEAARALATLDYQPQRTIRFVWFMGEEHGLHGSRAYVEQHTDELDTVAVMVNVDMPGSPRNFSHAGHPEVEKFLQSLCRDLAGFEISEDIASSTGFWSDHAPFMKQGICAVWTGGDMGPGVKFYHSSGDTYEAVDRRATNHAAAVLAVLVQRLADCAELPCERFDPKQLAEDMGWEAD